jgi:hypothetical protein
MTKTQVAGRDEARGLLTHRWFNRWSELEAAQKITCKLLKILVADAVAFRARAGLQTSLSMMR